jgi:hypothetical protein
MKMSVFKACLSCVVMGLIGCTSSQVYPSHYSGFLKDYSRLEKAESASGAPVMRWLNDDLQLGTYTHVYVEPSQFYPKPQPTAAISAQAADSMTIRTPIPPTSGH